MLLQPRPRPEVLPSGATAAFDGYRRIASPRHRRTRHGGHGRRLCGAGKHSAGTIKYLRVMETAARPWSARHFWDGDSAYQQHAVVSMNTHLHVKRTYGVVPVESDGSAHFRVPAKKNIFFQALDDDFMEVQRMRTFVNFQPGETRSCIGCHQQRHWAPQAKRLARDPTSPGRSRTSARRHRPAADLLPDGCPTDPGPSLRRVPQRGSHGRRPGPVGRADHPVLPLVREPRQPRLGQGFPRERSQDR